MTDFIKLSEEGWSDPKLLAVGPEGFTLYVKGLMYSKQHLLDGFVPTSALPLIGIGIKSPEKTAKALAAPSADLWDAVEGGYRVKPERWARWQTTKADVEAVREGWRERKERERQKKADEKAKRDAEKARDRTEGHAGVTRDTGGDSRVNHGDVTPQEKEKEKEKETPKGVSAGATLSPPWRHRVDGRWVKLGEDRYLASEEVLVSIEAWDRYRLSLGKGGISDGALDAFVQAVQDREPTESTLAAFFETAVRDGFETPNVRAFHRFVSGEYVPKGGRASGTYNPGGNPGGEVTPEAELDRLQEVARR